MSARRDRVLALLQAHMGAWIDGPRIASAEVGGSEGLRRLRELRGAGYAIQERRHPDPGRAVWQYRLVETPTPPPAIHRLTFGCSCAQCRPF